MDEAPDDRDPRRALRWYWERFTASEKMVEAALNDKYPIQVRMIGKSVELIYGLCVSPVFAIIVSFLLVPLVISEAISLTLWGCVSAAWLVAVFGVARQPQIKRLTLGKRLFAVVGISAFMALVGRQYIGFTLRSYYRHHQPIASSTQPITTATEDLLEKRIRELMHEEINKAIGQSQKQIGGITAPVHTDKPPTKQELEEAIKRALQPSGLQPPAIQQMSNKQLHDKVFEFGSDLRAFAQHEEDQDRMNTDRRMEEMRQATTKEEKDKIWNKYNQQDLNRSNGFRHGFDQNYRSSSITYRDELIRRLGPQRPDTSGRWTWSSGMLESSFVSEYGAMELATYLETLANQLPN